MTGLRKLAVFIGFVLLFILEESKAQINRDDGDAHLSSKTPSGKQGDSASDEKIFLVQFSRSGLVWQNEFENKDSEKFMDLSDQIEREFRNPSSFSQSDEILSWRVSRLQQHESEVIINLRVRTTTRMSPEKLSIMVSETNMNNTVIYVKELTTSIFQELSTSFLAHLSSSVILQTSSQTLDAPTTQTTSPMSTTPRWTTTHFSLTTVSSTSLISPSFSEKFMTSSEVHAIEEDPATEDLTVIVPTEKSPIKTQPTVPEPSIKFVVSMKVGSYNYIPEMADPESAVFKRVAKEIENTLYEELCRKKLLDCIAVEVFKLEKGSVIVSYNVHMASSTNYKQSHVNNVITDSANSGQLGRLKVSDVEVKKGDKEEEQSDSSSSRIFVYVLCGVGALLVIALIIAAISKYYNRRKNSVQVLEVPSNDGGSGR